MQLFRIFISHSWKAKSRSHFWQKSLLINILLGVFVLYFAANLLFLGFYLDRILASIFPDSSPIDEASRILFYYFSFDLLLRFFLQELPTMSIAPYLHLPIRRSKIFIYLLLKSIPGYFNIIPLFILIPFLIRYVIPNFSLVFGLTWILAICLLILTASFFTFYIKKLFVIRPAIIFIYLLAIVGLTYLDYSGYIVVSEYFKAELLAIANNYFLLIFPALILAIGFTATYWLLEKNAYFEDSSGSNKKISSGSVFSFLDRYGNVGSLIQLEIKMIMRNSRPKTMLIMSFVFLLYGFMIYANEMWYGNPLFIMGVGVFLTGFLMMNHGQFMFSWESSYFDFLLTRSLSLKEVLFAKYWLFAAAVCFSFIITLPYAFFNTNIAFYNIAATLYNIGVNILLLMYISTLNKKRIDLTKSAFFNYEGASVSQFLLIFPFLGFPVVIVYLFGLYDYAIGGVLFLGFAGVSGIVFKDKIIRAIAALLLKRKYIMSKGFRET